MECAAVMDAPAIFGTVGTQDHDAGIELLSRIVAMLTRLCRDVA